MSEQSNYKYLLSLLSPTERFSFRISDWINNNLKKPFMLWNALVMYFIVWLASSRRLKIDGLDNIAEYNINSSILLASNHRTFFDFFVITWVNFARTNLPRNMYFPVRSNFFYDNIFGLIINIFMGGCAMYPPIFRDEKKKPFNKYSMGLINKKLQDGGVTIGFHPEGRRNKNPDPYSFLSAKTGIGHVIKHCPSSLVIPVFSIGFTNNYPKELYKNWFCPKENPIIISYGKTLHFSNTELTPQEIADQVLDEIKRISQNHQDEQNA